MAYRFVANVNLIFFTQATNRVLAFIIGIILARGLGPDARGDYALFVLSVTLAGSLGTLGASLGTIYYVGKGTHVVRTLLGNGHFLVLMMGALGAITLAGVGLAFEPKAFVEGRSFWLYALAFPLVLEFVLVTAVLVGSERFLALNISMVAQVFVLAVGAVVLWIGGWLTIFSILFVWVFSYGVAAALALAYIGRREISLRRAVKPDLPVLKDQLAFGLPGQAGMVLQRLNYRLDQYVVRAFRSRADVGFYAVATGLAEAVWWIANAISMALLPRLTRMSPERAGTVTPVACRNTLIVSLLAAAGLAATAPLAVELLFGSEFEPAVKPILWLLPGIVTLSGSKVLNSYFFSQARMGVSSIVALVALMVTVACDVLLIPRFGISGAAIASSIAYTASFVVSLYYYQRISGNDPWACLIPKVADIDLYLDLARRLRKARGIAAVDTSTVPPG
jgi:O-antigen/teichoic acid export membrane protein